MNRQAGHAHAIAVGIASATGTCRPNCGSWPPIRFLTLHAPSDMAPRHGLPPKPRVHRDDSPAVAGLSNIAGIASGRFTSTFDTEWFCMLSSPEWARRSRVLRAGASLGASRGKSELHRARCWVTPRRGDPTAQCNRKQVARVQSLAALASARVKRWCKRPPAVQVTGPARQTPSGARPSKGSAAGSRTASRITGCSPGAPGRSHEAPSNRRPR